MVHVDSRAARLIGALALLSLVFWIIVLHRDLGWSLTILAGVAFIARGVFLNRPVTAAHAWLARLQRGHAVCGMGGDGDRRG